NIIIVNAGSPGGHPLQWKWWYDVKLPSLLKKYRADVFLACNGIGSLRSRVPQCLLVTDLSFLHGPSFTGRLQRFFYRRYRTRSLQRAAAIAVVSAFLEKEIKAAYDVGPGKITVIHSAAAEEARPLDEEEKETIRQQYTGGLNYFLYTGILHPHKNLLNLLRAFSAFKKRQQSNWKLVIAGMEYWPGNGLTRSLRTYKYRDDVVLTGSVSEPELARLTGAAYAWVYPSPQEGLAMPVLDAMQAAIPAIISAGSALEEAAGDAALYADPSNHQDIAEQMMRLYKDESLRRTLIAKGLQHAALYSPGRTTALLWQALAACSTGSAGA
ncbi:MAG: glycosyltransferase family 1 protein, partial [Chitinophagaceae bacterium]